MPQNNVPQHPELFTALLVFVVSLISATVSVTRRIVNGTPVSVLWLISEYSAAILCGWIAFDAYDSVSPYLPDWVTMFMFVAVAAHTGGKLLQMSEQILYSKMPKALKDRDKWPPN